MLILICVAVTAATSIQNQLRLQLTCFYDLNQENCENEQCLTCVKLLKKSVVCDIIPQIMGCLSGMGNFISF